MTKKQLMERIGYWSQLLLLPVYWFSFFVPRDKHIWLFGSTFGRRYADNPRYLYQYLSQNRNKEQIRPIWISEKKEIVAFLNKHGYEAYERTSLKGIWYCLRGKVYIFDNYSKDISFWLSGGAKKVNLWHGIPLKKIQADNIFDKVRHPKNLWEKWKSFPRRLSDEKPSHYVLTTSDFMVSIFASAFQTKNVLISGYPRNDRLISDAIENLLTDMEKKHRDKIIAFINKDNVNKCDKEENIYQNKKSDKAKMVYYMPTFRDSETKFFEIMNLNKFQTFLEEQNILFCAKLHPKSKLKQEFEAIEGGNIQVIDADTDPYVFLEMADVLITDYSSIYFDYLLTDKPIVFFNYDLEEYLRDSREMYFDYEEFTPGEKAGTQNTLENALFRACNGSDLYALHRKEIRTKVFNQTSKIASEVLVRDVKEILKLND